jgi:hypothetical protein
MQVKHERGSIMSRNLEQGIQAVQTGNKDEGARLIRIALKDEQLPSNLRAVGLLWLAETNEDPKFKIECYRLANQADPTNQDVSQRLAYWMARQLPEQQSGTGPKPAQPGGTNPMPAQNPQQGGTINPQYGQYQQGANQPQQGGAIQPQYGQYQQGNPQQNDFYTQKAGDTSGMYPPAQANQPPLQRPGTGRLDPANLPGTGALNPSYGQQPPQQGYPPQQNPFYAQNTGDTSGMYPPVQGQPPLQRPGTGRLDPTQLPGTGTLNPNYGQQPQQQNPFYQPTGNTSGIMPVVQQPNMGDTGAYGAVQPPLYLQQVQRSVGVLDGPNGFGTGFFVTREGLIVTTRYVVGGEQRVRVELLDKRIIEGRVVRSFPEYDLALIQVNVRLEHLLSVSQSSYLADNAPIIAVTHAGDGLRSTKRATRHQTEAYWFPTLINHLKDAGGNPIFTGVDNLLVGMLTKDASRSSGYMYGLHISKIYQCVEQYVQEVRQLTGQAAYCPSCGVVSRAPALGGYYCEHCGNVLPYAIDMTRYPQDHLKSLYGEAAHQSCPQCGSRAGFYKKDCLRCGFEL